jgi:hypothetical protein
MRRFVIRIFFEQVNFGFNTWMFANLLRYEFFNSMVLILKCKSTVITQFKISVSFLLIKAAVFKTQFLKDRNEYELRKRELIKFAINDLLLFIDWSKNNFTKSTFINMRK